MDAQQQRCTERAPTARRAEKVQEKRKIDMRRRAAQADFFDWFYWTNGQNNITFRRPTVAQWLIKSF